MPDDNVELEALLETSLKTNELLENVDANGDMHTELLDDIQMNTQATAVATKKVADNVEKMVTAYKSTEKIPERFQQFLEEFKGEKGDKGEKGEKGDKGDKGDKGQKGADSNVPGPQGEQGPMGLQGPMGPMGPAGMDGKDGQDGVDGKDGKDGETPDIAPIVKEIETRITKRADDTYNENAAALRRVSARDYDLKELKDVDIATTAPNQLATIQYSTARGKWLTGVSITVSDTAPTDPKYGDLWISIPG
jgi:hypothetical protein